MHVMLHMADLNLIARRVPVKDGREMTDKELESCHSGYDSEHNLLHEMWHVEVQDGMTGKHASGFFEDVQFSWLLWLVNGAGEHYHEKTLDPFVNNIDPFVSNLAQFAYDIVEPLIRDWPIECRPIP